MQRVRREKCCSRYCGRILAEDLFLLFFFSKKVETFIDQRTPRLSSRRELWNIDFVEEQI